MFFTTFAISLRRALVVVAAFAFSLGTAAAGTTWTCETPADYQKQGEVVVEMVYDNLPNKVPARVSYSKFGQVINEAVWRCQVEEGWCEEKAKTLVKKFADVGWECSGD